MFRTLLFALLIALPIGLVYLFGFWVLVAIAVVAGVTLLLSSGRARGIEETQGGLHTGYSTTTYADFSKTISGGRSSRTRR